MHLSRNAFDQLVEQAIEALPEEYAHWLDKLPVIVEDRPSSTDISAPDEGAPLGMFVGHATEDRAASGELPARIMIYREPLLDSCATSGELAEEIRKTLLHELGHYAGMDEDQLDELGYGPPENEQNIDWDLDDQ